MLGAQQHVVMRDHARASVRAAAHTRQRVRQDGPAGGLGERSGGGRDRLATAAADQHAARRRAHLVDEVAEGAHRHRRLGRHPQPGLAGGATLPVGSVEAVVRDGGERLAQRHVQVHRAGAAADCGRIRAAAEPAEVDGGLAPGLVVADLDEPLRERPEQLDLVDRLAGADVAQLGRAIGGQHDQRNARFACLDDRGQQVRGRGAGRGGDSDRPARRLREPERDKACSPLVQHRHRRDGSVVGQAEGDGRVARPGTCDRMPQPGARQFVDQRLDGREGAIDGDHL